MMFVTKKHISRRTILRGGGVTLALPFLEAMIPAATAQAQTAAVPKPRFVGCFVPHGMAPGSYWVPSTEGALAPVLPFNWKPLEPFRDRTVDSERFALPVGRTAARRDGRRPLGGCLFPVRRQTQEDCRSRCARRKKHRSDHRGKDRPG